MADPVFRVRYAGFRGGAYQLVELAPGMSPAEVERAVSLAVGLAPTTFGIRNAERGKAEEGQT